MIMAHFGRPFFLFSSSPPFFFSIFFLPLGSSLLDVTPHIPPFGPYPTQSSAALFGAFSSFRPLCPPPKPSPPMSKGLLVPRSIHMKPSFFLFPPFPQRFPRWSNLSISPLVSSEFTTPPFSPSHTASPFLEIKIPLKKYALKYWACFETQIEDAYL